MPSKPAQPEREVRYAVVGLGYIAQVAVLPAFEHARRKLAPGRAGLRRPRKAQELSKKYRSTGPAATSTTTSCSRAARSTPSTSRCRTHAREYAVRAAQRRHPRAVREADGGDRGASASDGRAARETRVKLMIAYRLHFERANLERDRDRRAPGSIGEPRALQLRRSRMQVRPGNIRVSPTTRRRHALRHRHLLHQRRALPVPREPTEVLRCGAPGPRFAKSRRRSARCCASRTSAWRRSRAASARPTWRRTRSSARKGELAARAGIRVRHGAASTA